MKKNLKKVTALVMAAMMAAGTLAGCGKAADGGKAAGKDIVTLKWIAVGSGMPENYDSWKKQVDAYLADKIGVNIDMEIVSWGDWPNRRSVIVSSGENYDILFTDKDRYTTEVAMNAFLDLSDMLEKSAPALKALIPEDYWKAVSIKDKIYSIPTYKDSSMTNYWVWDQAILDKYSLDPNQYNTMDTIDDAFKIIKDGEGTTPFPLNKNGVYSMWTDLLDNMNFGVHCLGARYTDETRTIINGLEDEGLLSMMDTVHQWYKDGYINADAATTDEVDEYKICKVAQGWSGAAKTSWGPRNGYDAVAVQEAPTVLSNSTVQGSLNAISANSKNPEKALQFLELINTDTYLRDLFYFGEEGVDWEYTADKKLHRLKTDWLMAGYTQGTFFAVTQQDTEEFNQWEEVKKLNEEAIPSVLLGFNFDTSKVETELANVRAVWEKYKAEFLTGSKEPREMAAIITAEMKKVGLDTLLAEAQSQVDSQFK